MDVDANDPDSEAPRTAVRIFLTYLEMSGLLFFQRSSSSFENIFDELPALSAPPKSDLRDELDRYLSTDPEHVTDALAWWYEKWAVYIRKEPPWFGCL